VVSLETGQWSVALATDAPGYGGQGEAAVAGGELRLPGHTGVLLRRTDA
jgi:hypothetical protein